MEFLDVSVPEALAVLLMIEVVVELFAVAELLLVVFVVGDSGCLLVWSVSLDDFSLFELNDLLLLAECGHSLCRFLRLDVNIKLDSKN